MRSIPTKLFLLPLTVMLAVGTFAFMAHHPTGLVQRAHAGTADPPAAALDLANAFEQVAETIAPSVVTIRSVKKWNTRDSAQEAPNMPRFFFGTPFRKAPFGDLFGEDFFERLEPFQQPGRGFMQHGEGSGVIVTEDGYVLTNSHVVNDADEVTVILNDDRQYTAEVIGTDAKTDLAVIKIDSDGLQAAKLGSSDDLRVGQWVVAAGNPFGLTSSITAGIVSATGRSRVGVADYEDFIQTDAAINPGNSGGPLVNLYGEVVGINTAIFSRGGGNNGVGFAIPVTMAKSVMDELIADGRVVRGYLGVLVQDLSEGMAKSFDYDSTEGALISEVTANGPASSSGLQAGDIVTHFNGARVPNASRLKLAVADVDPGTKVDVRVFRNGRSKTIKVEIGELPADHGSFPTSSESADLNIGMTVETLTPAVARNLGIDGEARGVVVTGIEPFGPAARAGIRPRDVITRVHNTAVDNVDQFRRAMRDQDLEEGVRLVVQSGSARRFIFLQLRS